MAPDKRKTGIPRLIEIAGIKKVVVHRILIMLAVCWVDAQFLSSVAANHTCIGREDASREEIIAHLQIHKADNIMVLDGGRLAEQGALDALMSRCGSYFHLWQEQQKNGNSDPTHLRPLQPCKQNSIKYEKT